MESSTAEKFVTLKRLLRETDGLLVAFSGGVDSTFLAAVAQAELGDRALAVTATSPLYPAHERREAEALARSIGIRHLMVESDELAVSGFAENPPDRCYLCKRELFSLLRRIADEHGLGFVADGTNTDDRGDYRPGRRAAAELGVVSPLLEANLAKGEIRSLSQTMGLPTANKAAFACLASRIPYGSQITREKLLAVGVLEDALRERGFYQFRVRHHGELARIEVVPRELARLVEDDLRKQLLEIGKKVGFVYVALDLQGYRTGSLNETLNESSAPLGRG